MLGTCPYEFVRGVTDRAKSSFLDNTASQCFGVDSVLIVQVHGGIPHYYVKTSGADDKRELSAGELIQTLRGLI